MFKRMTWGQVKNKLIDNRKVTVGDRWQYVDNNSELPKNNRLVIVDFDKQKLHDLLLEDGYGTCKDLNLFGKKAPNIFAKVVIDELVGRLRGVGINVVDVKFTWYDPSNYETYTNGNLEWLKSHNFINIDVRSFDLVIEGRKGRRLRHRFKLGFVVWGERVFHRQMYANFLYGSVFSDEQILINIHAILHPFEQELQKIYYYPSNFERYCEKYYDIDNENRELIYQKIYDDLNDIRKRVTKARVKIEDDRFGVQKRMSS